MNILLVDDDPDMRRGFSRALTLAGHQVTEANDGLEGLSVYRHGEFDFVITDYQMPRKNGVVLLMQIRGMNPTQKMALISADPPRMPKEVEDVPVLQKPFRISALLALLK